MKYLRIINRKILPLAVALSMVVPANASAAYSKDTVLPGRGDYTAKDFIPFRNYIPTYLPPDSNLTKPKR